MHNYRFGFNVFNFPPEDFIDYSYTNNLSHIEINTSLSHSNLNSFSDERIDKLINQTSKFGINLSLHLPNQNNIADSISFFRKSSITYLSKAIELADKLGAVYINCHMGFFFWFPIEKRQRNKSLKRFIDNLKIVLELCSKHNIILALENVTPLPHGSDHLLLGDSISDFEFVFSRIDSPYVKFCLDTGHANLGEGIDKYIDSLQSKLCAIHFHDNLGRDDSHLIIGEGNINWSQFGKRINDIEFKGPFVSECRNQKPHEAAKSLSTYLINDYKASPLKS